MKKNQNFKKIKPQLIVLLTLIFSNIPMVAFAADQPKIISGTIELVNAATSWLLILAPITGALFGMYHAIRKSMSDDETEIKRHSKMIKNAVIGVIIALCLSGIINFVSGFYS